MNPIKPTVGRVVLVRSSDPQVTGAGVDHEVCGLITRVFSDTCINIMVMRDGYGSTPRCATSISYDDSDHPESFPTTWRWMDYQREQAAKHDPNAGFASNTAVGIDPHAPRRDYAREQAIGQAIHLLKDGPDADPDTIIKAAEKFHAFMSLPA